MKTDDLIRALARDGVVAPPPGRTLARNLACGAAVALLLLLLGVGVRPDLAHALHSPRFLLKPLFTLSLLVAAAGLLVRLAVPGARLRGWSLALLVAPALLAAGVLAELATVPAGLWRTRAIGSNALWCLVLIPALAIVPLICGLLALRQAAPTRPALTGATAGLLAGSVAASFYAFHCTDDSPLFVCIWYCLALLVVTLAGTLAGSRLLRW